jgi:hypothetical protein
MPIRGSAFYRTEVNFKETCPQAGQSIFATPSSLHVSAAPLLDVSFMSANFTNPMTAATSLSKGGCRSDIQYRHEATPLDSRESVRACLGVSGMKGIEGARIPHYLKLNSGVF